MALVAHRIPQQDKKSVLCGKHGGDPTSVHGDEGADRRSESHLQAGVLHAGASARCGFGSGGRKNEEIFDQNICDDLPLCGDSLYSTLS